jgi:hypothetical protein
MKKNILKIGLIVFSLSLFSFASKEIGKSKYNVVEKLEDLSLENGTTFTRVTYYSQTSDKGTWERHKEVWKIELSNIAATENTLNNY